MDQGTLQEWIKEDGRDCSWKVGGSAYIYIDATERAASWYIAVSAFAFLLFHADYDVMI